MENLIYSLGTASLDIFFIFKKRKKINFNLGDKIEPDDFFIDIGGGALNSSFNFKNLGFKSKAIIKLGNDFIGKVIKKRIEEKNIDANIINFKGNSTLSFILLFPPNQIIFTHRGETKFKNSDIIFDKEKKYFIFTGNTEPAIWSKIIKKLKKFNNFIGINPSKNFLKNKMAVNILNIVDFVNFNKSEAEILLKRKIGDNLKLARAIKKTLKKPKFISITLGNKGAILITNKIYLAPILKLKVIDTTGAGDSYSSTLFAYLINKELNDEYIKESIKKAIINTTCNLKNIGAQTGLLNKNKLEKISKKINLKIKIYSL